MKLSDYLVQYLVDCGISHVFIVVGGACAHIIDSLGRNDNIDYVCVQHEQAAGMAADAYSRITNNFGVAVATSGPGATNLLTALCCSWFDSIPCLFITGQVNRAELKNKKKVRQLGFQETDIVKIASSITKFAVTVKKPGKIKYYLDRALYEAKSGRPGPVLIDIPLDVQHAKLNIKKLEGFRPAVKKRSGKPLKKKIAECLKLMSGARRPVLLVGAGIRIGKATLKFKQFAESLGWPVVSTWSGIDLLPHKHPQYVGQIGIYGNRGANFTVQNCDLLIAIGSRLDTRQTGGEPATFARGARKVVVDIDQEELEKGRVAIDVPINLDASDFLSQISLASAKLKLPEISSWVARCGEWKNKYPGILQLAYYKQKFFVNPYVFIDRLSSILSNDAVIVCDIGANTAWTMQAFKIKEGQRIVSALGFGPMGYGLGAAIGACLAQSKTQHKKPVICILGDGGMQVNIQELQTIVHYKLPIKIFVLNNNSYGIIKQFQDTYFDSAYYASGSGYSCPDFIKIGKAYGLLTKSIKNHGQLTVIEEVLRAKRAVLCNIAVSENQKIIPKLEAIQNSKGQYISKPIEDQWPYLDRREFLENMIIDPMP